MSELGFEGCSCNTLRTSFNFNQLDLKHRAHKTPCKLATRVSCIIASVKNTNKLINDCHTISFLILRNPCKLLTRLQKLIFKIGSSTNL